MSSYPEYSWCGTDSIYLAFSAPNTYYNSTGGAESTLPYITSDDPNEELFRILVPSVILPTTVLMFFLGREYFTILFSLIAAGIGSAISYGIVYGRPVYLPINTPCASQWGATAGGAALGLIIGLLLARFLPKMTSPFIGGLLSFAIFQQYPQLDLLVTGFPELDDFNVLFLGWGLWPMWSVTLICSIITFIIFCFGVLEYWRKVMFVTICGGWAVSQSVRLIARNMTTYNDGIPTGWSITIFAIATIIIFALQPLFDTISCFTQERPSSVLPSYANTVRRVNR